MKSRCVLLIVLMLPILLAGCRSQKKSGDQTAEPAKPAASNTLSPEASPPHADIEPTPKANPTRPHGPIQFVDITEEAGIHFKHHTGAFGKKYLPETMGSGVCFIDYDNDGWQDIFLVQSMDWPEHKTGKFYPALYHNNHDGTFTDVTREAGLAVESYGMGCAVGDFDNDGYDDLYLTTVGSNHLYRNLGNGKFADVTARAGVANPGFSASAAWFDYDNDGKLDLFVTHYIEWSIQTDQYCSLDSKNKSYCTPQTYKGESSYLYHNLGNGKFEDVTKAAKLYDPNSKALGIALLDYDNDGWMDLFVTNDTEPNKLYRNRHDGTFSEEGINAGVAFSDSGRVRAGMGTDAADFDDSGYPGLLIGNFTNESMALYRNDGSGLFIDETNPSRLGAMTISSLTFGALFLDYDNDGYLDIFAANGHVSDDVAVVQPTMRYAQPAGVYRNTGNKKFEDVSAKLGSALQKPVVGRGMAYADIDNDGDLDLVITANNGTARLLRNNNGNQNDVLRMKLIGTKSNRDAIGAKVRLSADGGPSMVRMVKSGSSYLSQSELPLSFGLGKAATAKNIHLQIAWPSGLKEKIDGVNPNQFLTIKEGRGIVAQMPIASSTADRKHP